MIKGRVSIDEASIKIILEETKQFLSDITLIDFFIEENRCLTFKVKMKGQKISIKIIPVIHKGCLGLHIFKIFYEGIGLDLSWMMGTLSGVIKNYFKNYPMKNEGEVIYFPDIQATFAGITKKEVIFDGKWKF
jgi:hypothetical protein